METNEKQNFGEEKDYWANFVHYINEQISGEIERLVTLNLTEVSDGQIERIVLQKKDLKFREEWLAKGHGFYSRLVSETHLINTLKNNERVVLHVYNSSIMKCEIIDNILEVLAKEHIETKFGKIAVEKAPHLCHRLKVESAPAIILFKHNERTDLIVDFDDLTEVNDFSTKMLESRLSRAGLIVCDNDLSTPSKSDKAKNICSSKQKGPIFTHGRKRMRRGSMETDDSEGDDGAVGDD